LVALGVVLASLFFVELPVNNIALIIFFAVCGAVMLGALGLIAGVWAEKFDQIAAFQNFVILPMTFLSGVFYSVEKLPAFWKWISHANPFFYLIDGFRRGFFGHSDTEIYVSVSVVSIATLSLSYVCLHIIRSGYKLRT